MARIERIDFTKTGKNDGCTCDKCGQYITNIWTAKYSGGLVVHYGMDCFDKLLKDGKLSDYGVKLMHKALKRIKDVQTKMDAEKKLTEETDIAYQYTQEKHPYLQPSAWYGVPWEEYHEWMLNEFWPYRMNEAQKELAQFSKINFPEG